MNHMSIMCVYRSWHRVDGDGTVCETLRTGWTLRIKDDHLKTTMCFWVSVTLDDCRMQSLWRRWSPQTSESVENWSLWVQKRFWSKHQNFEFPQNLPCSSYKSSDWSQSLISGSLEVLEGSVSVQNTFCTHWDPKLIVCETSEVVLS